MRYLLGVVYIAVPWNEKLTSPWYLVIERTTNVSSDWKIRMGTDDKAAAERELKRLNREEETHEVQPS